MIKIEELSNITELKDDMFEYHFNLSTNLSESYYKSHILPGSSKDKISNENFREVYNSYELIPVQEAVHLRKMFIYVIHSKKFNDTQFTKATRNYKIISNILNGIDQGSYTFYGCNNVLCLKYNSVYGFTKNHDLGRIFPNKSSINQISKEFRYHLFKGIYNDVDIINAHPTILYRYSKNKKLNTPMLKQLVNARDAFYELISNEYNEKSMSPKKLALICLNTDELDFKSNSLNKLNSEIINIRNSLYEEFYLNDISFKSAIDFRMKTEKTEDISVKLKKIQTLYCHNIETETIMKFKKLLFEKWHKEISVVPFFDGLFIENTNKLLIDKNTFVAAEKYCSLESLIEEFNKKSYIKLGSKKINPNFDLFTESLYVQLKKVLTYIDNLTNKQTRDLLDKYKISLNPDSIIDNILDNKKVSEEIVFSFEEIQNLKKQINTKYARFIDCILNDSDIESDI